MNKIKNILSNILNISPVFIQLLLVEKDEAGITVIFKNLLTERKMVIEFDTDFRLLSYYPL